MITFLQPRIKWPIMYQTYTITFQLSRPSGSTILFYCLWQYLMMNSNKAVEQQRDSSIVQRYFLSRHRYDPLERVGKEALSMIEQGKITVKPATPFPLAKIQQPKAKKRQYNSLRLSNVRPTQQKSPPRHQTSHKNKRFLQSLLQKYRIFEAAIQKLNNSEQNQRLLTQIFEKICHYEELLMRNSPQRLPVSQQEKQFIEQQTYNIRLAYAMAQDEAYLKEQARIFNCSLHRKNKYYDCLEDIRKKISSLQGAPQDLQQRQPTQAKPVLTELSESTRITAIEKRLKPLVRPQLQKGRAYLNYSKQIGVKSKQIYENERGKVVFLKQIVHNWWPETGDVQRVNTVQSALN